MLLFLCNISKAQVFYYDISEDYYKKIITGQNYYPSKILLVDSTVHEGYVARLNDSNIIRFKESMDNDAKVYTLTEKHVISFIYGKSEWKYPKFVYKKIKINSNREKIRYLQVILRGDISIYLYRWVDIPDATVILYGDYHYTINTLFFLEKDGVLYEAHDFSRLIVPLIKDKEEVFNIYKKNRRKKYKKIDDYKPYIELIDLYNKSGFNTKN